MSSDVSSVEHRIVSKWILQLSDGTAFRMRTKSTSGGALPIVTSSSDRLSEVPSVFFGRGSNGDQLKEEEIEFCSDEEGPGSTST